MAAELHIGTCSWKYDAWRGLVYSDAPRINYLGEYAKRYACVEVDQWFWSLFGPDKVALPKSTTVQEYALSVPADFRFGIKLPNALTLTHFRPKRKTDPLVPNPHFLSHELLDVFLRRLDPLRDRLGPLMFQFGYLNKRMMPSETEFLERLARFADRLPAGHTWCVETRNPNYLNADYFACLSACGLSHVFLQGYYMPSVFSLYPDVAGLLADPVVIRLHGPDREGIEERTGQDWSAITEPRDDALDALASMLSDVEVREKDAWLFANNHFEGCAPLTIERIHERLRAAER